MDDQSHLDNKYFIDWYVYNCPFCNRRHVSYHVDDAFQFNWSATKRCFGFIVQCNSCQRRSMHLSFTDLMAGESRAVHRFTYTGDLDSAIFYSVPTSFFVMDERIPRVLRELVTEAEGSLKMNFLVGSIFEDSSIGIDKWLPALDRQR